MFALLLANLAFAGKPADTSAIDWYKSAAYDALSAVGTDKFGDAIDKAVMRCDDRIPDCADNNDRLRGLDERARAEVTAKAASETAAEKQKKADAAVADAKKAKEVEDAAKKSVETTVDDSDKQSETTSSYRVQPAMYYVDQPTGIENVGGYSPPPAPWTGVKVVDINTAFPTAVKVCVMKDGTPIPFGPEVPFAESHDKGTPVYGCPAATIRSGLPLYVPDGAAVQIASFDIGRQAFVIDHVYVCNRMVHPDERVETRGVKGCGKVK